MREDVGASRGLSVANIGVCLDACVTLDDDYPMSDSPLTPDSPLFSSPYDREGRAHTLSSVHTPHDRVNHRRVASADKNVPVTADFSKEFDVHGAKKAPPGE